MARAMTRACSLDSEPSAIASRVLSRPSSRERARVTWLAASAALDRVARANQAPVLLAPSWSARRAESTRASAASRAASRRRATRSMAWMSLPVTVASASLRLVCSPVTMSAAARTQEATSEVSGSPVGSPVGRTGVGAGAVKEGCADIRPD